MQPFRLGVSRVQQCSSRLSSRSVVLPPMGTEAGATCRLFSSVSTAEVNKFSKLSTTWWDPRENPLIGMNVARVEYITKQMAQEESPSPSPLTGLRALDVGCGGGLLSESLCRLGAEVTSVDPSEDLVRAARAHSQLDPRTRSIDYRGGWTVERLAQESEDKFDVICFLEVIEHVTDPDSILSSIESLLKPDGTLFISTVNRTIKSKLAAIVGAEYVMRYLPVGTHDWNEFLSPEEVRSIVQRNGFEETNVNGMIVNSLPLCGTWDWQLDSNDTDVNWIGTYRKSR